MTNQDLPTEVDAAYFFIPLPDPLGIPDGTTLPFYRAANSPDESLPGIPTIDDHGQFQTMELGLVIHQVPSEASLPGLDTAFLSAHRAFPDLTSSELGTLPESLGGEATIIVAICPLRDLGRPALEAALDFALAEIRRLQRRYYIATKRPIRLIKRGLLPPVIPHAIRTFVTGESTPNWPDQMTVHLIPESQSGLGNSTPKAMTGPQIEAFSLTNYLSGGPFEAFADLRREAALSRVHGSTITSSILIGAMSEALLREIFMLLLWDSGTDPARAAELTPDGRSIHNIAKTEFHGRLQGNWSFAGDGPVAAWATCIKDLRNKTAHDGYTPSEDEISKAAKAATTLEHFIGDRLRNTFPAFPLATRLFVGERGFKTKRLRKQWKTFLANNWTPDDHVKSFRNWQREVRRNRTSHSSAGTGDRTHTYWVQYVNGDVRWWLVDLDSDLACLTSKPGLSPSQQSDLASIKSDSANQGKEISVGFELQNESVSQLETARWHPAAEVVPFNSFHRFETCRVAPPLG